MQTLGKGTLKRLLLLVLLGVSSWTWSKTGAPVPELEVSRRKSLAVVTYTEELLKWQRQMGELYQGMAKYSRSNRGAISSRHLEQLRELVNEFHQRHFGRLDKIAQASPYLLGIRDTIEITTQATSITKVARKEPLLESRSSRKRGAIRFRTIVANQYRINPNDEEGRKLWLHFKNQLTAKVMLLESYMMGLAPFLETKAFRMVLIRDLKEDTTSEMLEELWFSSMEGLFKRNHLVKAIEVYQKGLEIEQGRDLLENTLKKVLLSARSYQELERRSENFTFFKDMAKNMSFMAKRRWDAYQNIGVASLFEGSKVFGNFVGLFQSRNGYLYDWSKEKEEQVASEFKALDIVMEKTPFRLTDKFIPGYFGHAAIWTGGEKELKELGVWQELPRLYQEAVEKRGYKGLPFQEAIRKNKRIIEALRPGVQLNSFRHFLQIDDLAVIRMRDCQEGESAQKVGAKDIHCLTPVLKKEYLMKAFEQVGKDYDFAFNVNTEETIVCSELIYRTYLDIDFETTLTVGQHNISPDQVAKKADESHDPFSPVMFYHQGEELEMGTEDLRAFMRELMN